VGGFGGLEGTGGGGRGFGEGVRKELLVGREGGVSEKIKGGKGGGGGGGGGVSGHEGTCVDLL